jgi:hypothetical protein
VAINGISIGQELLNVPMGDMIQSVALSIAKAQWQLDKSSMTVAELMSGRRILRDLDTGELISPPDKAGQAQVLDSRVYFGYTIDLKPVAAKPDDLNALDPTAKPKMEPVRVPQLLSMMELGFTPTFYQFVDTIIEVKIAISIRSETAEIKTDSRKIDQKSDSVANQNASSYSYRGSNYWSPNSSYRSSSSSSYSDRTVTNTVTTSQVNAAYSQKFGYSAEGSSLLRTKLVPVPPPTILEDRIREVMRIENAYEQWNILQLLRTKLETELKELAETNTEGRKAKNDQINELDARIKVALDTLVNKGN